MSVLISSIPRDETRYSNPIETPILVPQSRSKACSQRDQHRDQHSKTKPKQSGFALSLFFPSFDRSKVKDTHRALFATFDRWGPDIAYQITNLK